MHLWRTLAFRWLTWISCKHCLFMLKLKDKVKQLDFYCLSMKLRQENGEAICALTGDNRKTAPWNAAPSFPIFPRKEKRSPPGPQILRPHSSICSKSFCWSFHFHNAVFCLWSFYFFSKNESNLSLLFWGYLSVFCQIKEIYKWFGHPEHIYLNEKNYLEL